MIQPIWHSCFISPRREGFACRELEDPFPLSIHPPTGGWFSLPRLSKYLFPWEYTGTIGNKCWHLHAVGIHLLIWRLWRRLWLIFLLHNNPRIGALTTEGGDPGLYSEWGELASSSLNSEDLNSCLDRMTIRKSSCFCFLPSPFLSVCRDCKLCKAPACLSLNTEQHWLL